MKKRIPIILSLAFLCTFMSTVPNVKAQEPIIKDENKTISPYKELNKNFQLVNEKVSI